MLLILAHVEESLIPIREFNSGGRGIKEYIVSKSSVTYLVTYIRRMVAKRRLAKYSGNSSPLDKSLQFDQIA